MSRRSAGSSDERLLIDDAWYLEQYPDVAAAMADPRKHYNEFGRREGRDPNPLFDTNYYLATNPDVANAGTNPLAHYLNIGWKQGANPNPLFDTNYYLATNPDVANAGTNPLAHYLHTGMCEDRWPSWIHANLPYAALSPACAWSGGASQGTDTSLHASRIAIVIPEDRVAPGGVNFDLQHQLHQSGALERATLHVARCETPADCAHPSTSHHTVECRAAGIRRAMHDLTDYDYLWLVGTGIVPLSGVLQQLTNWMQDHAECDTAVPCSIDVTGATVVTLVGSPPQQRRLDEAPLSSRACLVHDAPLEGVLIRVQASYEGQASSFGTLTLRGLAGDDGIALDAWLVPTAFVCTPTTPTPTTFQVDAPPRETAGAILWFDNQAPHPDQDSGSVRALELLRIARADGHLVVFVPAFESVTSGYCRRLGLECVFVAQDIKLASSTFQVLGRTPHIVWVSRPEAAAQCMAQARAQYPDASVLYDTVDAHVLRLTREMELNPSSELKAEAAQTITQEAAAIEAADIVVVVSDDDAQALAHLSAGKEVAIIGNIHRLSDPPRYEDTKGLIFVGAFAHRPNVDAILWFVQDIWPRLDPAIRADGLSVVGSNPPAEIRALADNEITFIANAPDVEQLIRWARVSIAPLRFGAGVKGKVGQAMALGIPVVGTTNAFEGLHAATSTHADAPETITGHLSSIYFDADMWRRSSASGIECVESASTKSISEARKIQGSAGRNWPRP